MKRLIATAAAAVAGLVLAPAPAQAMTATPQPVYAFDRQAGDGGWNLDVAVELPRYSWGMRGVIRNFDDRIGHLRLHLDTDCEAHPTWRCVKVKKAHYGQNGYLGWTEIREDTHTIYLNKSYRNSHLHKRQISCHEFGHAVGLDHHHGYGCVSQERRYPSRSEIRALRRAY